MPLSTSIFDCLFKEKNPGDDILNGVPVFLRNVLSKSLFLFFFLCNPERPIPIVNPVQQIISIHSLNFAGLDGPNVGIGG